MKRGDKIEDIIKDEFEAFHKFKSCLILPEKNKVGERQFESILQDYHKDKNYKEELERLKLQKTYKPYWKNIFISECREFHYEENCDLKCFFYDKRIYNGKVSVQYDLRFYCAYMYSHYSPYYLNTEVLNFKILEYIPQEEIIENADATQPIWL
jgi:hypothetical protein